MEKQTECQSQPQKPEKREDPHQLVLGWRAAEKLEPWDETQNEHWKNGFRLFVGSMFRQLH